MVTLKNVLTPDGQRDINVEVAPFNRRNDEHVRFAFACADLRYGSTSRFSDLSDAAEAYVDLFMHHKEEDAKDPNSDYSCVKSDLRACRTLFFNVETQKQFDDFFANA